jgi:hypothetical protein
MRGGGVRVEVRLPVRPCSSKVLKTNMYSTLNHRDVFHNRI